MLASVFKLTVVLTTGDTVGRGEAGGAGEEGNTGEDIKFQFSARYIFNNTFYKTH